MGFSRTDDELERLKQSRTFSKSTGHVDRQLNGNNDTQSKEFSAYKKLIAPSFYGNRSGKQGSRSSDELR